MSPLCLRTAPCSLTDSSGLPRHKNAFGPPQKGQGSANSPWFAWCVQYLHAVVVCALPVEVAAVVVDAAVIQGAEAHEAVLQGIVPLLVHVVVPDHVLLASEPLQGQTGRQSDTPDGRGQVNPGARWVSLLLTDSWHQEFKAQQ